MASFNPFARSTLKIPETLVCLSCNFDGWGRCYRLEYRASRASADVGKLQRQFKIGTPLYANGKHLVVRTATFNSSSETPGEVLVSVEALDFQTVLAGALGTGAPVPQPATRDDTPAPARDPVLRPAGSRRILR